MTDPNTNTENVVENAENEKPSENSSTLYRHPVFAEYCNEDLLYPIAELEKWKKKLHIMRTRTDGPYNTNNVSPIRRPTDDEPLHEVFRNIMDKDFDPESVDEENFARKYRENRIYK